ncbi:MAG: HEAT repeat domain-containing protein, partial [Verrucomicrobiae bacterium]|nr:HEAT repeat domain-containing protein [Verrucomicrobiae bacterium]
FDCPKSQRILEQGCEALARNLKAKPDAGNEITRSLNALALLASGREEYLPLVRRQVEKAAKFSDPERKTLHSWLYGPVNLLLAEYTLATGDRAFLPDMERITMEIVHGQSAVGSWGHRFVPSGSDGRLGGYGMMNAPGLPLTVSLILARDAGIRNSELDEAIAKSLRMLRFYAGKGSVPYGDHHPWIQTHDDNGKNGIAALMFHLVDDVEAASFFSRMSVASYGAERDTGHTGNFFNLLWAMPGVALSGPHASGAWMKEYGWYYDLARRWDGSFLHQGAPEAKPDKYGGWDATGAYLLAYAQPLGKILLAGRKPSIVAPVDPAVAANLIEDGQGWSPRLKHSSYANRTEEQLFAGLASWSPVVRERSGLSLAERKGDVSARLIEMLEKGDLFSRLGACQAFAALGPRGAPAVPSLRKTLQAEDLWLRIKAADALASIGDAAMPAVPDLLALLATGPSDADPRGMQQRYLCFALFDRRDGLLKRSLEGVDREALFAAVRAGLRNEDGRARGVIGSVYQQLSFEEIEPLLPAIRQAVIDPAPSGIMFADGIRLSGLEVLARHRIEEGMTLCLDTMEIDRWGKANRIKKSLEALQLYGAAAKPLLPRLEELEKQLGAHPEAKSLQTEIDLVRKTMDAIRSDPTPPSLRSLDSPR